jgi:hypothetical protein
VKEARAWCRPLCWPRRWLIRLNARRRGAANGRLSPYGIVDERSRRGLEGKAQAAPTSTLHLAKLVDEFAASEPYTLTAEPGEGVVAYRLHIRREAPAEISTVVGSALDSVAYELALRSKGELTEREEQKTSSSWRPRSIEYDRFFGIGVYPKNHDDRAWCAGASQAG